MPTEFLIRPYAVMETDDPNVGKVLWTIDVKIDGVIRYSSRRYIADQASKLEPAVEHLYNINIDDFSAEVNWIGIDRNQPNPYTFEVQETLGTTPKNSTINQIGLFVYCVVAKDRDGAVAFKSNTYGQKADQDLYMLATSCQERRERCNPIYWTPT